MSRRILLAAVVVGVSFASQAGAEGISFPAPEAIPSSSFNSSLPSTSPFGSPRDSISLISFNAAPPSSLTVPALPSTNGHSSSIGNLTSRDAHRLFNPVSPASSLPGTSTSNLLTAPGRYDSGASSRLSTMPTTSSGMIQQFQIPTTNFGTSRGLPATGAPSMIYAPSNTPQVFFGTK